MRQQQQALQRWHVLSRSAALSGAAAGQSPSPLLQAAPSKHASGQHASRFRQIGAGLKRADTSLLCLGLHTKQVVSAGQIMLLKGGALLLCCRQQSQVQQGQLCLQGRQHAN